MLQAYICFPVKIPLLIQAVLIEHKMFEYVMCANY
jgi:hypothetical protein